MVFKIKYFIACVGALFLVVSKFPTMAHKHIRTCYLLFMDMNFIYAQFSAAHVLRLYALSRGSLFSPSVP